MAGKESSWPCCSNRWRRLWQVVPYRDREIIGILFASFRVASIVGECQAAASSSLACAERDKAVLSDTHGKTHLCMLMQFELFTIVDGWEGLSDKLLPNPKFWKESI